MRVALLIFFSLSIKTNSFRVIDKQVNENRAYFQYHSEIIEEGGVSREQGKSYKVFNFLKNNDRRNPLSIEWEAANLSYIVSNQLRYTDRAPSVSDAREIRDPFEYPNTPIFYGNGNQNTYQTSCYIERSKAPKYTAFNQKQVVQHRDENGVLIGQIMVTTRFSEDLGASVVNFEVKGGADLVFKQPTGSTFNIDSVSTKKFDLENWLLLRDTSLVRLLNIGSKEKHNKYSKFLIDWLNSSEKEITLSNEYVLCKNNSTKSSQLKLYCSGSNFEVSTIRFLAVNPRQQVGVVGFASDLLCVK